MPTVLVVDDNAADRKLAGGLVRKAGDEWTVVEAVDGVAALDEIERARPDVVVTDLQMPEMDGLALVTAVHADHPTLPVILMTAAGSEEIAVQALQQGAASYVPKRNLAADLPSTLVRIVSAVGMEARQARLVECIVHSESRYEIENDISLVSALVHNLQQGVGPSECLTVATALDEALHNAYYHGNLELESSLREEDESKFQELGRERREQPPYAGRRIRVTAVVTPEEARYTVSDDGPGFDPSKLPDPTDPANLERPHGRGLLLMRTFMDEVTYNDRGNEVTMVKRRQPRA